CRYFARSPLRERARTLPLLGSPSGLQTNGGLRGLHSASAANPPYDVFLKSSPAYGFGGCTESAPSLGSVPQPGRSGTIRCPASLCGGAGARPSPPAAALSVAPLVAQLGPGA